MRNEDFVQIPVIFQRLGVFKADDTRFEKVKIWLMHLNENLNGSFFSKQVVNEAIPSLANTPILGFIELNNDEELDFSDHRTIVVKTDDGYELKYLCSVYGVIPETNNAKFEKRVCDDGIEREFLTCEGLIWTKWDDPLDILNRDKVKGQSMEIHKDYKGVYNKEDGLFHFTEFKFFGACILGDDVKPAMRNATVEKFSLDTNVYEEIQKQMELFKTSFENHNKTIFSKGGNELNEIQELLAKYSVTEEQLQEKGINIEEFSLEDLEVKIKEIFETDQDTEDVTDEDVDNADGEGTEENFALMAGQLADELYLLLNEHEVIENEWGWKYGRYSYIDHNDTTVFTWDTQDHYKIIGFPYSLDGDKVTIDFENGKRYKVEYTPFEEGSAEPTAVFAVPKNILEFKLKVKEKEVEDKFKAEIGELKSKLASAETELATLQEFKEKIAQEQRLANEEQLFGVFDEKLKGNEEYLALKENKDKFSVEELEKECYAILGKQMTSFSFKENQIPKVSIPLETPVNKEEKSWSHLVYQYRG